MSDMPLRIDYKTLCSLIRPNSKVLDLGCGNGELLMHLSRHRKVEGTGIEISLDRVQAAMKTGLSVIHGDLEEEIQNYQDQFFDFCILSQTLQELRHPEKVLLEMLRISKRTLISFYNLAHLRYRLQILFTGRFPKAEDLPYKWLSTNIFFLSVRDFHDLCHRHGITIHSQIYLAGERKIRVWPSLRAKIVVLELSKSRPPSTLPESSTPHEL